jgi:hypothetical protein
MRRTILHRITDIMAAVDVMDMEKDKNKDEAEDSISRILSVRHPRCRENKVAACFPEFGPTRPPTTANRFDRTARPQLLFRNPRVFQQERLHIGKNEARVERSRTVDISDAPILID